jgi:hypothetical protein
MEVAYLEGELQSQAGDYTAGFTDAQVRSAVLEIEMS